MTGKFIFLKNVDNIGPKNQKDPLFIFQNLFSMFFFALN